MFERCYSSNLNLIFNYCILTALIVLRTRQIMISDSIYSNYQPEKGNQVTFPMFTRNKGIFLA
jgi:hypothetical protein